MQVIRVRNVCEALSVGVGFLMREGVKEQSRNGPVLVAPCPVTTVYDYPTERVLLSTARDANPFFHLYEAMWMLAGRRDAESLNLFVKDFGARFAEPDGRIHDAYGYRWRNMLGVDQLDVITYRLKRDPTDRQCVLQMWSTVSDLMPGPEKTRPCNTHAYFRVRQADAMPVLDMTVCCRSNDMILGGYGANAVHFSVLQEYLAARIDVLVGRYYQLSNNCHVYESELEKIHRRMTIRQPIVEALTRDEYVEMPAHVHTQPLVYDAATFDHELTLVMRQHDAGIAGHQDWSEIKNRFLVDTFWTAMVAFHRWRSANKFSAITMAEKIAAPDWRRACVEWMNRRKENRT